MKMLLVLTLDVPEPEKVSDVLFMIDPKNLPYFAGTVRICIDPVATKIESWLDE